ncbi:sodium/iodide cotransporter-like [Aplysia californica]|uniref:Sodium/iodide cotransporter-like n=1 Tax=Aplysia californica TaxID=6500 RepID=A0ABM0K755_APLCA|nr:sodium/iodide cotransporter-like [Aplysia californica]
MDILSSAGNYLVGGRKMTFLPVAISLMVSFESSIMMLGLPAEIYCYGMEWMWYTVGVFVAQVWYMGIVLFGPAVALEAVQGTIDSGGPKRVVDIANEGGRFKMFK